MMMRVSAGVRTGSKSVSGSRGRGEGRLLFSGPADGAPASPDRRMSSTAIIITPGAWACTAATCSGGVLACVSTTLAWLL